MSELLKLCQAALAAVVLIPSMARCEPNPFLSGLVEEPSTVTITLPDGTTRLLEALLIRPDHPGKFPVALMTPGTPRETEVNGVANRTPEALFQPAVTFAQHGYASIVVLRRGFGRSQGPYAETTVPCGQRDYRSFGETSAVDMLAAATSVAQQPWADPARIVLVGKSTGGFAVAAAAGHNPTNVVGVVDVAGGRGSTGPNDVCQPEALVAAMEAFGREARIPSVWLFSANDQYFGPQIARQMFEAYTAHGAPAELAMLSPFGTDGHDLFDVGPADLWWPAVAAFLERLGLPTRLEVSLPPMPMLTPPAGLTPSCARYFATYTASRTMGKAAAVGDGGRCFMTWTRRTTEAAVEYAMDGCAKQTSNCHVYAKGASVP